MQKKQLYVVLLIVLLGFIGNSIAYPIFAPLFLHPDYGTIVPAGWGQHGQSICLALTLMMYPLGQFLGSPLLGGLSDQHGRKSILIFSAVIMTFFYLLTAMAIAYNLLWLLMISRFLTGCCEGNISIAWAIVADNPNYNQHKCLGLINAMASIGYIIGPVIGGVLASRELVIWFDFSVPFYMAALFSMMVTLLSMRYLQADQRQRSDKILTIAEHFNLYARLKKLAKNKTLLFIIIASTIASLADDTFYEFYPPYLTGTRESDAIEIAWYTVACSVALAVGCGLLSHNLAKYFSSRTLIKFNMPILALALLLFPLAQQPITLVILFIIIGLVIGITTTNFTIEVSRAAEKSNQGEVFGMLWGLRMLLDSIIIFIGAGMLLLSFSLPIFFAGIVALLGWAWYLFRTTRVGS